MKKNLLALLLIFLFTKAFSQITYIGITNHNTGSGSNNLFNNYVAVNQQCYIDWEVYAEGMTDMEACGFRSDSRLILRRQGENDSTSVVASAPVIVPGICAGKVGNNDHYYVDLGAYIDKPGRYSVEIQADVPNATYPFENAGTKTTCNYSCPSAYYLTGTSGPTGNYYTPTGNCTGGPGLSDPVGGQGTDMLTEIFAALHFFTVGEAATYREMIVLNGNFYDTPKGKFQPGNPTLPANLNGTNGIPVTGICATQPAPQLSIGGEVNTFKRTDCVNADIQSAGLFYSLHKAGQPPSAYAGIALDFKDDCPANPNGPQGNNFSGGGSCQNANGILDQRWQTVTAQANILPPVFQLADTGTWYIRFYTQLFVVNCAGGTPFTLVGDTVIVSFTVIDPQAPGVQCTVIPVVLSSFTVSPQASANLLTWKVEEAVQLKNFEVQRSFDGYTFTSIAMVGHVNNKPVFNYADAAYAGQKVFYRIVMNETDGSKWYSFIVKVNGRPGTGKLLVQPAAENLQVQLQYFTKGKYSISIIDAIGNVLLQKPVLIIANGNTSQPLALKNKLAHGIYYAILRDEKGNIVSKSNFYY